MPRRPLFSFCLCALSVIHYPTAVLPDATSLAVAENHTVATLCAEHDNVNIPLLSPAGNVVTSLQIEARHPAYSFGEDHGDEDFTNCPPPTHQDTFYEAPGTFSLHDDGVTAVVAVREGRWWRPQGMRAIGSNGAFDDIHYIAVHRKLSRYDYPQVLVLYSDGNLRLKPFPPPARADTLFGSSVVVGPARISDRPFVNVRSIEYHAASDELEVTYDTGETATLVFEAITREATRVRIECAYRSGPEVAFATFRSMYVREGNTDVDHVHWVDSHGREHESSILAFSSSAGREFLFQRQLVSRHNTSAPDLWIGAFRAAPRGVPFLRGDANGDGARDIGDPLLILAYEFLGGVQPACLDALDFDDSGEIDVSDALGHLAHLFLGAPAPIAIGWTECAVDPSDDPLECEAFAACGEVRPATP